MRVCVVLGFTHSPHLYAVNEVIEEKKPREYKSQSREARMLHMRWPENGILCMVHHGQPMKTSSSSSTDENVIGVCLVVVVKRARMANVCGHRLNHNKSTLHDNQQHKNGLWN